jgi:hypothetical protein
LSHVKDCRAPLLGRSHAHYYQYLLIVGVTWDYTVADEGRRIRARHSYPTSGRNRVKNFVYASCKHKYVHYNPILAVNQHGAT